MIKSRLKSRRIGPAVAALCLFAASCSRGVPGTGAAESREAVLDALARPPQLLGDTARYRMEAFLRSGADMTPVYTAEGVADFKAGRWRGTVVRERFPNGEGDEEAFGIDEFAYRRPAKGGEWKRFDLVFGEIGSPFPGVPVIGTGSSDGRAPAYALDPDTRHRIFDAAILDIDPGDVTEMHGAEVRRYRVHMAGEEEIRTKLPKPLGDEVAAWDQYGALKDLNLWVDGESRLVAYEYRPDDDSLATVREEWWDFGEAPEVPIPEGLDENGSGTSRFKVTPASKSRARMRSSTRSTSHGETRASTSASRTSGESPSGPQSTMAPKALSTPCKSGTLLRIPCRRTSRGSNAAPPGPASSTAPRRGRGSNRRPSR